MTSVTEPNLRVLSLGAGVQSSTLAVLAARGDLPHLDAAIFADTGWEPAAVYAHLDRLEAEVLAPAGIALHRVRRSEGGIRADALDPNARFATMPLYLRNPDGKRLLGAVDRPDGTLGRVPRGRWAEQWIGISLDEADRAVGAGGLPKESGVSYSRLRYPLLERELTREECLVVLRDAGFTSVPKSACIGCPFHTNRQWREMRDERPEEFADAVEFDAAIRQGSARARAAGQELRGEAYLHRSRLPLSVAPVSRVTAAEWAERQGDFAVEAQLLAFEEKLGEADREIVGCSPFACRADA